MSLEEIDPEIREVLDRELVRQQNTLEMIASENFAPKEVMEATGSVLTNKYAEGYPGKRYYGGCEEVDVAEQLAIQRAKDLFGAEHVNVQPHSGAQANTAVFQALLDPGDTILGLRLDHGGHLTHGMKLNVSGKLYNAISYEVGNNFLVDMNQVEERAKESKPKMIIAGWSAYSRHLDFQAFRDIADQVGAYLMVDMAHFAGLVAAKQHPSPFGLADIVTTTTHKTLCGPRGGMIFCKEELQKDIDRAVFPGQQGGPLMHTIAAKAVALKIASSDEFKERQIQTIKNAQVLSEELIDGGIDVLTDGTDTHLFLVDLRSLEMSGKEAEEKLEQAGITVNRNSIPHDTAPPLDPSGLRIGTPALTTRGMSEEEMRMIAEIFIEVLVNKTSPQLSKKKSQALCDSFPLYSD